MNATPIGPADDLPRYEIRLTGHLHPRWSAWFEGLCLIPEADGTTILRGPVIDQTALHGVLQKVRDLGLPLVSVTRLEPDQPSTDPARPSVPERKPS